MFNHLPIMMPIDHIINIKQKQQHALIVFVIFFIE